MRWFRIREAKYIDSELRNTFEQYGVTVMQQLLSTRTNFLYKGSWIKTPDIQEPLLLWLTEQHDRAERKETWSLSMEAAITVFVLFELVLSLRHL